MKYKRAVLTRLGGPEGLQLEENDLPEPRADEVRVKVLAAGVAFADVMMRHGKYPGMPPLPFTPGYDIVGCVEKCGAQVSEYTVGQRVTAMSQFGGYSQYICLPASELLSVPEQVDAAEVVCLVLNYITAYQMLHRLAHSQAGESILVHGAAGGVGTALLQLGKLANLVLYGTVSSAKLAHVADAGAIPIDYKREDFVLRIKSLTGAGVDVVFDPIGGTHIRQSYQALREGGRLVSYGLSASISSGKNLLLTGLPQFVYMAFRFLFPAGKRMMVYSVTGLKKRHPEWFRTDLTVLLNLLAEGKIKPVIAERLPLDEVARAHELLERGQVEGKVVLLPHA